MHLHTTVKVRGRSEEEACLLVELLLQESNYGADSPFDYYGDIKISDTVITEEDFKQLREREIAAYRCHLERALEMPDDVALKGVYLRWAGESLSSDLFYSTERLAWDYTGRQEETGGEIYYVDADRHF
jgi:hypothetical protein